MPGACTHWTMREIRRLDGSSGLAGTRRHLVRVSPHLRDLAGADAILLQQTARGVGAVGGELPIGVAASLENGCASVWPSISSRLGRIFNWAASRFSSSTPFSLSLRAATLEEGATLVFDQFDLQALRR